MVFRGPNIQAHCNEAVLCLNFGTPENNEFSIWDKWKIYYLQVSQYLSTLGYFCDFPNASLGDRVLQKGSIPEGKNLLLHIGKNIFFLYYERRIYYQQVTRY